jgi:hypothetical protein
MGENEVEYYNSIKGYFKGIDDEMKTVEDNQTLRYHGERILLKINCFDDMTRYLGDFRKKCTPNFGMNMQMMFKESTEVARKFMERRYRGLGREDEDYRVMLLTKLREFIDKVEILDKRYREYGKV